MDRANIEAIKSWETPRSVKGIRSFLRIANDYRDLVPNFSDVAHHLTVLTKRGAALNWTNKCEQAFQKLRDLLFSGAILAQWDPDRRTVLETDSSGYAIEGAPPSTTQDDERIP